jgi:hypothetical protein
MTKFIIAFRNFAKAPKKEELTRIEQMNATYIIPVILSTTSIVRPKLHDSLNVRPAVYIFTYKAVILNTCLIDRFLAEQRIRSSWSVTRIQNKNTRTRTKDGRFMKIMKAYRDDHIANW